MNSQPISEIEKKVDITKPQDKVEEVVQAIRTEYPTITTATVISATETKVSTAATELKVDFYVPEGNTYKVNEAKVVLNNTNPEQTYTVTSITEVVNNGVPTHVVLEKTDPTHAPNIINAAYGFEKLDLTVAAKNPEIQSIESEIQRRYSEFIAGESVTEI